MQKTVAYVLIVLSVVFGTSNITFAQQPRQVTPNNEHLTRQLRVASQFERLNQYHKALEIYRALEPNYPNNPIIFDGIVRNMLQLKQYDDAVTLCQTRLETDPDNAQYLRWLGESLIKVGQREEGIKQWERILQLDPSDNSVITVANLYFSNGMLDEATQTYLKGRQQRQNPTLFSRELARIYEVQMNFREAIREYLLYMYAQPSQQAWVEGRIKKLAEDEGIWSLALEVTQAALAEFPNEVNIRKVLGDLYLISGQAAKGLAEIIIFDQKSNGNGRELLNFGRRCMDEGEYETARHAFDHLLTHYPTSPFAIQGQIYQAETLSKLGDYDAAIEAYRQIINRNPRSNQAADAYVKMGNLYLDKLHQPDNAIETYSQYLSQFSRSVAAIDVRFRVGDAYLVKGELENAQKQYESIMQATAAADIVEKAKYKLGYLALLQGDLERAGDILTGMIKTYTNGIYLNDALRLQFFLDENKDIEDSELQEFLNGWLLSEQIQYEEAIRVFQGLVTRNPNSALADDALFQIALQYEKKGDYEHAITAYHSLTKDYPASPLCPEAMDRTATIYSDVQHDYEAAKVELESILFSYPESLYADLARKKLLKVKNKLQIP